jgi:hypothetical protein
MAKKPKLTPAQIRNHIKKIEDIIEKQKREHEYRGEVFKSPTREEIEILHIDPSGHLANIRLPVFE